MQHRTLPIAIAAGWWFFCAAAPAGAADPGPAVPAVMTSTKTRGEVSVAPEPKLLNGELILKVVALNRSQEPATFGPEDIRISTADGKSVPIMSLESLIAQVKAGAAGGPPRSGSAQSAYVAGPATTYNQFGQPDVHNFTGSSAPLSGRVNPEAPEATAPGDSGALEQQIASLKAGILQDLAVAPGEVKGGELVTGRIRFHWREKHTLHIEVRFNGEEHEFDVQAPPQE
jgi:hypothetical protein